MSTIMTVKEWVAKGVDLTGKTVIRLSGHDYKVRDLFVTPSGAVIIQYGPDRVTRAFLTNDSVTLVRPVGGEVR
jgi:hypothetical protein